MHIFVICTVRLGESNKAREYVEKMESEGHIVHYPPRDTNQVDDTGGWKICNQNMLAIKEADEVHVFYDARSQGILFDLGISFSLKKKIKLIDVHSNNPAYDDAYRHIVGKSFPDMIRYWEAYQKL